jgi:His-Xaa-Ser system protein HxsD
MRVNVDLSIYPLDVVLRASHRFTARCYVIPHADENGHVTVELVARDDHDSLSDLHGKFANALLDAHLRALIAEETRPIRELLVAQAFCEGDLLDRRDVESDEHADPKGIAG